VTVTAESRACATHEGCYHITHIIITMSIGQACPYHTPGLNFMGSPFQSRCTGAPASSLGPGVVGVAGLPASLLPLLLLALSRLSCSQAAMSAVLICTSQHHQSHSTAQPVRTITRTGQGLNRPSAALPVSSQLKRKNERLGR
jgi:hypothetical protein